MQINEENANGLIRDLKVTILADEIGEKVLSRLAEVGKEVKLPGFRPGKVPMNLLKSRFGESVRGEVLDATIQEATQAVIKEKSYNPAQQPKVDLISFEEGQDLEFSISLELLPEIELADLSAFDVEKLTASAGEKEISENIDKMAEGNKSAVNITESRAAELGDVVVLNFDGSVDGESFEGGKASDFQLELGSGRFIPGFEEQLVGMKVGAEKDVNVTFPNDYHNSELASKSALFKTVVTGIQVLQKPEINEEFAKSLGFDDIAGLREAVEGQINKDYEYVSRMKVKRELLDYLAKGHLFDVPPTMRESELKTIWDQVEKAKESGQLDEEDQGRNEEELKAHYTGIAERRVRLGLLLSDVANKNQLTVSPEELSGAVAQESAKYPGQEQAVVDYYQNNPQGIEQLRAPLLEDKVVDFLLGMANVSEKAVSSEKLLEETGAAETDGPVPAAT